MGKFANASALVRGGAVALAFTAAVPAVAQTAPGVDFTTPGLVTDSTGYTLGYQFTANTSAAVVGLATWDDWAVTPGSVDVGLWDAAGNLLASATVTSSSPTIGSADWSYASIVPVAPVPPVTLTAGDTYYVASFGSDANFTWATGGLTVDPRINFVLDAYVSSTSLQFPTNTSLINADLGGGYFGGNVILGSVPEPSTWAMMLAGLAGLGLAGWRRARKAGAAPA
jgi:hypothetical protein